jgi:hypothetical protein
MNKKANPIISALVMTAFFTAQFIYCIVFLHLRSKLGH